MRAIGYQTPQPIDAATALVDFYLPRPEPTGRDILVAVEAVSVNPVDTKIRASAKPADREWKVLGWDAAGVVTAVGPGVTDHQIGDRVAGISLTGAWKTFVT